MEDYSDLIEKVAKKIVQLRLTAPAIIFLESSKPLSFLASQAMVFFEPFIRAFFNFRDYERFYKMLENRENVEKLIQAIEKFEEEFK